MKQRLCFTRKALSKAIFGKGQAGETSKLTNHRSWEENWNHVFYLLGNGGGGKDITVKKLVKEMLEDFPGNNQLKEIYKHIKLNGE
ncbi:MAG: hypothetical protein WDO19_03865 [Bacteroidota bacterium]